MVTSRDSFYKRVHFKGWVHSFQIPPLPNIGAQPEKKMQKKKKKNYFSTNCSENSIKSMHGFSNVIYRDFFKKSNGANCKKKSY